MPAVDMVAFMNPRKSRVDIVQAIGRAMPKAGPDKKFGYVVVPLLLDRDPGETIEEALKRTDFEAVADVVNAMREQDGDLVGIIQEMRVALVRDGAFDTTRLDEKVEVIGPKIELSAIRDAIDAEIVERLGSNWDEKYGRLISYKDENSHCNVPAGYSHKQLAYWVRNRRPEYKKGTFYAEYVERLNAVGFVWSLRGAYNTTIIMRAALLAPIFTVGVYSGLYLFRIAPADWFKKVTYTLLVCTALIMLAT